MKTSPLSVNPSLIQRFRKIVKRDLQGVNDFFMKAVACGNPADKHSAFETLLCVSYALQEVPGGVCDYRKGDVPVNFEVFPSSC